MKNSKNTIVFICMILFVANQLSFAENAASIPEAIANGTPSLQLRLGFEYSTTDDMTSPAKGLNLRTRLGYRTADYYDTNIFLQFQSVTNLVEDFRFPGGGDSTRDVIADPDGERVNQFYLEYNGLPDTKLRLGRQEIILDDHRFIGHIGWRQNGQTFDALSLVNKSVPNLTLNLGIINQVNTIFLTHVDLDHLILLNAKYKYSEGHSVVLYSYLLDTEVSANTARDSITYGLKAAGKGLGFIKYDITYALQDDYQDGENHDADLFHAFIGLVFEKINGGIGYSRISGQDGTDRPFDTLFSTAHKFNGWADQFLATNGGNLRGGLEDMYLQISTVIWDAKILARYHFFDTTEDSDVANNIYGGRYGKELDVSITRKIMENLKGQIKYAYYDESESSELGIANPTTDEQVVWTRLMYSF